MGLNIGQIDPQTIQKLLFGGPQAAMMPSAAAPQDPAAAPVAPAPTPDAQQPGSSAPPRGAVASAIAPKPPSFEDPNDYAAAHPEAVQAHMTPRPVGDFDTGKHAHLRRALATLFGGLAEFGGDLNKNPGQGAQLFNRWAGQDEAQRAYDAGLPKMKAGAVSEAFKEHLGQVGEQSNIAHTQAETRALDPNDPNNAQALQRKSQFIAQLQGEAESGKYDPLSLKARALRIAQANRIPVAPEEIDDLIQNTKPLGAKYQIQQDKNGRPEFATDRQGNRLFPDAKGKFQDPELQSQWDSIAQSHQQALAEEEGKEKRVAGYAADRQGAAFEHAEKMQGVHAVNERANTALDADERLSRMERAYQKGLKGDQQAMLALLTDHIGMTMGLQKGARITKDILNEAQGSMPWLEKIGAKFDDRGFLSGAALGPEQMRQMLDLGYEARDRAYGSVRDAATMQGVPVPKGFDQIERKRVTGAKPAIEGSKPKAPPAGATHTAKGSDGKLHFTNSKGEDLGVAE